MALPAGDDARPRGASPLSPPGVASVSSSAVRPFARPACYFAHRGAIILPMRPMSFRSRDRPRPRGAGVSRRGRPDGLTGNARSATPQAFERITSEVVAALRFYGDRGGWTTPKDLPAGTPAAINVTVRPVKTADVPTNASSSTANTPRSRVNPAQTVDGLQGQKNARTP